MAADHSLATDQSGRMVFAVRARTWLQRHASLVGGLLVLALGLVLCLYRLDAQSLWLDEAGTWAEATGRSGKGWLALLAELFSPNAAYPLYHLLIRGWVALAGDSEWALRLPSALAGTSAIGAAWLAAREFFRDTAAYTRAPLLVALLAATSPYALWYAQDAKVYSLLLLVLTLLLWALLRALRLGGRSWLLVALLAVLCVFTHRLALLPLAGVALVVGLQGAGDRRPETGDRRPETGDRRPETDAPYGLLSLVSCLLSRVSGLGLLVALLLAVAGVAGTLLAVGGETQGGSGHVAAGPLLGLWISLAHFASARGGLDGWLGIPLLVWLLPALVLTALGLWRLALAARQGERRALTVVCLFLLPLGLLMVALLLAPVFEARYAAVAFPAWLLVVGVGGMWRVEDRRQETRDRRQAAEATIEIMRKDSGLLSLVSYLESVVAHLLLIALLAVNGLALFQPQHGQFSGAPVKEQWREALTMVARQAQPDDLLILHPYYVLPLWEYYAPRVTPDPLPRPVTFNLFAEGFFAQNNPATVRAAVQREYNRYFNQQAFGKKRMLLLIAPDHARTIDPPKTLAELQAELGDKAPSTPDKYGWLGLRFQIPQKTWPCGGSGDALIGVELMCQSFPETFNAAGPGKVPAPAVALPATFGNELQLRGYTINAAGGTLRPGGTLPITLYWQAAAAPTRDYTMFLHLCRDCSQPPLAQDDRPPLAGYPPAGRTTTWQVGDPLHDERAIYLPPDLPAGRYTLLLGVYPAGDPAIDARLAVQSSARVQGGTRLVLAEVTVTR